MEHAAYVAEPVSFISIDPVTVLTLVALGFLGGMLSGFIGSGGAFVLTPGMMSLGVPGPVAVASNMCHKFPKALVGVRRRRRLGHVDLKLGVVMAASSIVGVEVGVGVQNAILEKWGTAGSNLYISIIFVLVLTVVGVSMVRDARRAVLLGCDDTTPDLPRRIGGLNIPPMLTFKEARARVTLWVTLPLGFGTGLLAATIAVGGFIGVPSMIYIIGAPTFVASGTELLIAFFSGLVGTYEWAMRGLVDLRLVVLILGGSLVGVQVGALGTSYVREYTVKFISGVVMVLAAISRAVMVPAYLSDVGLIVVGNGTRALLATLSTLILYGTLVSAGTLIVAAMVRGKRAAALQRRAGERVDAPRASELSSAAGK